MAHSQSVLQRRDKPTSPQPIDTNTQLEGQTTSITTDLQREPGAPWQGRWACTPSGAWEEGSFLGQWGP